jgi:Leucine-rich repeat (LRR) protein
LDSNEIVGSIPTEIGLLTELASISITNSTLSGPIPTEMGNLSELRRLWLYDNQLSGIIPSQMSNLAILEVLELHLNDISGAMPAGVCASIEKSEFESKALTADCVSEVTCAVDCCTKCYD